jgi:hypothetical protein
MGQKAKYSLRVDIFPLYRSGPEPGAWILVCQLHNFYADYSSNSHFTEETDCHGKIASAAI